MITFPHAKINLGLYIVGRRPDGYHNILSCFYPIPLADALEMVPSDTTDLRCVNATIARKQNSVWRLLQAVRALGMSRSFRWWLLKGIPSEAGLGGGSADAAFALRMLCEHTDLRLSHRQQVRLLAAITADGPFFLQDRPAIVEGLGDRVTPIALSLAGWHLTIIKPDVGMPTAEAYARIRPAPYAKEQLLDILRRPVEEWQGCLENRFEGVVFERYPYLRSIKDGLYRLGAVYVAMSGSGTSFFALSEGPLDLLPEWERWKVWGGDLPSIP